LNALAEVRSGWTLPGRFYVDPGIFAAEFDAIWRGHWLFAGHSCEVSAPGEYFLLEFGNESLILVRGNDGRVSAFHNVCRHRGSRICDEASGTLTHFVCPYHQWSYRLDGSLRACAGVDRELALDARELALVHARVEEVGGLVFVSVAESPIPFEDARTELTPLLAPQGLEDARVAARRTYTVSANWKLVWENNRECWHCHVGHPEYIRANYDTARRGDATTAELESRAKQLRERGLDVDHADVGLATFPSDGRWWSANRTPTVPGFVTESLDGRPVAPPMGSYDGHDVGTLRVRVLPGLWCHASADHVVTTRVLPVGPRETQLEVTWLVAADAEEGVDYDLAGLMPFWQLTSEQDWALCERNQRGVVSSGYRPGPLSLSRERNVAAFLEWYRVAMTRNPLGDQAPGARVTSL